MELVTGLASVSEVDDFVTLLKTIGTEHDSTIQAFDAQHIVDREHLVRAVELADRAISRGVGIADGRAMEILCYAAGTRQIEVALEMGVSVGDGPVVVLIDGGDEASATEAIRRRIDTQTDPLGNYDAALVRNFYDIGDAELGATQAGIPALVRERVALLVVER